MTASGILDLVKYYSSFAGSDLLRAYLSLPHKSVRDNLHHARAGVDWLCRAQDAVGDGGVSRGYTFVYNPYFRRKGWLPSYPETTGYIIPTLFDYANQTGDPAVHERAIRMAEWESNIQMENGAVQGGTVDQEPSPAIFNTGQVLFGWVRAYQETRRNDFLESARRAGEYLVGQQDADGAWRKNLSKYASSQMRFYTYNTRTAWALLELYRVEGNPIFREATVRNVEFALGQQLENGWFRSNCLNDETHPLLHTIAYCIRGILEIGCILKEERYVDRARCAADALRRGQRTNGSLSGRYDRGWQEAVSWSCLTGNAQIAIIWGRLHQITTDPGYLESMSVANRYLKGVQFICPENPDLHGGICGSYPVHGRYGRFEILNWGVKFFVDSLMLEDQLRKRTP